MLGVNPPSTALYYTNYDGFNASDAVTLAGPALPLDGSAYDYTLSFTSFPNVTGCAATCAVYSAVGGGTAHINSCASCLHQRHCLGCQIWVMCACCEDAPVFLSGENCGLGCNGALFLCSHLLTA